MRRLRGLSRANRFLAALVVGGAVFGIATAVQASIPDSNGVAHGCYYIPGKISNTQQLPGDLRLIDTDAGQHCNSNEGSVDLATTGYVNSTVNQTMIMGQHTFPNLSAGDHHVQWTCGGWIAANPTVAIDPFSTSGTVNNPIALHGMTNMEEQTTFAPGTTALVYFTLASTQNLHTQITCVDPRVYGETYPVSAPRPAPKATLDG